MATLWYFESDGKEHGPISAAALKRMAEVGRLQPSDLVWKEGSDDRRKALAIQGLFARRQEAPRDEPELVEIDVEVIEEGDAEPPARRPAPRSREPVEVEVEEEFEIVPEALAEVEATYRGGHPDLEGPVVGTLVLESTGLRFLYEADEEEDEIQVPFRSVEDLLGPGKGDFPPGMRAKALGAKLGGKAGRLASGLVGNWLGGTAGDAIAGAGDAAGKMAEKEGELGKPPRNRIAIYVRLRKQRTKVAFDVNGANRNEMTEEAQLFYKKIRKAYDKVSVAKPEPEEAPIPLSGDVEVVEDETPAPKAAPAQLEHKAAPAARSPVPAPVAPVAGKPFRVMRGTQVRGPYSLEEVRGLMSSGGLREGDLIGVETWLPLATIGGLLAAGAGPAPSAPTQVQTPTQAKPAATAPMKSDDGLIPADDEFRLH
jgi:hypothetical protein